ncbi:MAG: patatin-like phospholipase family protein [Candidatus Nanopelagicales bacterium]
MTDVLASLPRPAALVLGAGGQDAPALAGMLGPVLASGWRPDILVGTSGGAVTAACLIAAGEQDEATLAADLWRSIASSKLVKFGWTRLATAATTREGGRLTKQWRELLDPVFGDHAFSTDGTQAMVATNLTKGQPQVINSGSLVSGILASAAFPVLASAVESSGDVLVDGSFTAPVPVLQALELGAASVVALVPGRPVMAVIAHAPSRWFDVVLASVRHQMAAKSAHDIAAAAGSVPVVAISCASPLAVHWSDADRMIEAGRSSAADQLGALDRRWARIHESGLYAASDELRLDRRLGAMLR